MLKKIHWSCFILYMAIFGSFCGLEMDSFVEDLPFFEISTLLLFFNVIFVLLLPPLLYSFFTSIASLWNKRALRNSILIANSIYFHFALLFALYRSARDVDFDFYFFWYNATVALSVLWKLYAVWLIVIALSVAVFVFFQKLAFAPILTIVQKAPRKAWIVLAGVTLSSMLCQIVTIRTIRGSVAGFFYASFFSDRQLRTDYRKLYGEHIASLQTNPVRDIRQGDPSIMGDIVFFSMQESLNSFLLSPEITPQILQASRDGVLFGQFYANSIQSERGYECILCGAPPSIAGDLVEDYALADLKRLNCLPRLFKALGYYPIAFYGGYDNPRVMRLYEAMGFEKILTGEIMQPGDIKYDWGYREDIYATRIDEYLQKNHKGEKLFVLISDSATNHTPFKVHDEKLLQKIPFPKPKKFQERLANTTFAQDAYFGHFYDIFQRHYLQRASLIAVSDHAWPISRHKNNIFNERGSYEENFLAVMLFVPPLSRKQDFNTGSTVPYRFSQMDILPTVLDLIGIKQNLWLGESFAPWLLASTEREKIAPQKTKVSVQPYGGGFVSAVAFPQKYLFDVLGKNVKVYDLQKDPAESSPAIHRIEEHIPIIRNFFNKTGTNPR